MTGETGRVRVPPPPRGADARELRIGAGTTGVAVGADAEVRQAVPLLTRSTPFVGHLQIRNRGTLGGSIAHADAAGEYPAVALTLDAVMEVLSPRGRREIAAADFFSGVWETTMEPDEVLTGVRFPSWGGRSGFSVQEFSRRHGDFAIAGALVAVQLDDTGRISRCAIGLLGLESTGTHPGCEHGACGACTVLLEGDAVRSCLLCAVQADGTEVTTVEGIAAPDGALSPVQSALRECHGLQCGFCTPGFVTSLTALLRDNPDPTEAEIREGLSGNFCRCTGYQGIVAAAHRAAGLARESVTHR